MSTNPSKTTRRLTTPEQRARIVAAYQGGATLRVAAAAEGVAYSTAWSAVTSAGVERRKRSYRSTPAQ